MDSDPTILENIIEPFLHNKFYKMAPKGRPPKKKRNITGLQDQPPLATLSNALASDAQPSNKISADPNDVQLRLSAGSSITLGAL